MNDRDCQLHFLDTLPSHWQQLRLKHLVRVFGGGTPSKERGDFWEGAIPWVSPRDMKRSRIEKTVHNISVEAKQSANLPEVPKESVLLVTRGMILVHSFPVAIAGDTVTINQDMKALAPRKRSLRDLCG
jgi:type I restriction enzyme S subunit